MCPVEGNLVRVDPGFFELEETHLNSNLFNCLVLLKEYKYLFRIFKTF